MTNASSQLLQVLERNLRNKWLDDPRARRYNYKPTTFNAHFLLAAALDVTFCTIIVLLQDWVNVKKRQRQCLMGEGFC